MKTYFIDLSEQEINKLLTDGKVTAKLNDAEDIVIIERLPIFEEVE